MRRLERFISTNEDYVGIYFRSGRLRSLRRSDRRRKMLLAASIVLVLIGILIFGLSFDKTFAETDQSVLYVPLIGITSVPVPLSLPDGEGDVTYKYAVKNFIRETDLADVQVIDDKCSPVKFVNGDDNANSKLDYSETWRYTCTTKIFTTTFSTATAVGMANNITATHKAYATVIVGSNDLAPLVSIINITKVAYPLSLPREGGEIVFTYKVNNPGEVPLSDVSVDDDKCNAMSGKLGDTNSNNLLDTNEVWIYTCRANLKQTTTNTARVTAFFNGLKAVGEATLTVNVETPVYSVNQVAYFIPDLPAQPIPSFPETGENPSFKIMVWIIMLNILIVLIVFMFLIKRIKKIEIYEE